MKIKKIDTENIKNLIGLYEQRVRILEESIHHRKMIIKTDKDLKKIDNEIKKLVKEESR